MTNKIMITVGDRELSVVLAENSSAEALVELLQKAPITVAMKDYGNMEKVGIMEQSLPSNNQQITTEAGDVILYQGNALVIYYDTNHWSLTRLGKIQNTSAQELKTILGKRNVTVQLSLEG